MGLLDTAKPVGNTVLDVIDDARVVFVDGTEAGFDRVEFVSGGRLKATLVTSIDVGGGLVVPVANIVHYASGSWKSVQEPPRGCLVAFVLSSKQPERGESRWVVEANILEKEVTPHGHAWMKNRIESTGAGVPSTFPPPNADSSELLGTRFRLSRPVPGWPDQREDYESILFRWVSTNVAQDAANSLTV
ncbi:hypothetical protein [Mycolicibacterium lutetiense]|uniref:Uncharacterized protein n=1 Tax=Mycolicibacterium lutetiense TaxID=1641992 RepID=A0ABS5A3C3_9MYCO|nr:hypothetical protein [Mycolicibacterium lutetiense]MBP2456205.1 hypothetical protein [Mycolicibacterium lutetiense]